MPVRSVGGDRLRPSRSRAVCPSRRRRHGWVRWCSAGGSACWPICCPAAASCRWRRPTPPAPWSLPSARSHSWRPRCGCSIPASRLRETVGKHRRRSGVAAPRGTRANYFGKCRWRDGCSRLSAVEVSPMSEQFRGDRVRRGGRRPGWALLTVLFVLAIAASCALVFAAVELSAAGDHPVAVGRGGGRVRIREPTAGRAISTRPRPGI